MRLIRCTFSWLVAGSVLVLTTTGAHAQVTKRLLENFAGDRYLDTSIFTPSSPGWGVGVQEVNREIRAGKINMQIRSTSVVDSADTFPTGGDRFFRRNRLFINPDLLEDMVGLEAEVRVNSSTLIGCPIAGSARDEDTASYVRAMLQSAAFNDGSSTGEGDFTGDYFVDIALEKTDTRRTPANLVDVAAWVTRADSDDAGEATTVVRRVFARVRHGDRVRLSYIWNLDSKVVTFKMINLTRRSQKVFRFPFRRQVANPVASPNVRLRGTVQSRTVLPRCRPDRGVVRRPSGMIDADFDNIFVFIPRG